MSDQMEETRTTVEKFIEAHAVTMTCDATDHNPHMDNSADMDHWRCFLRCEGRRMQIVFSKGMGHKGARPTTAEVLDCLASDATSVDGDVSFADFCGEFGYDTDSRKAERTYNTIRRQAQSLNRLLGEHAYQKLLWNTERS